MQFDAIPRHFRHFGRFSPVFRAFSLIFSPFLGEKWRFGAVLGVKNAKN
jgi:hypothetical protein